MQHDRRSAALTWLLTTVLVAGGALLAYHFLTRVPALAGRIDPAEIYTDPTLLFTEPGLLGTAVEMRATEAVQACMREAGFSYRGPAVVENLADLLDAGTNGYGLAAGPPAARPRLGTGGAGDDAGEYEEALYGTDLAGAEGSAGGCAAAGRAALDTALVALTSLPYSLEQLQADALSHPAYSAALADWSACLAGRGYQAASPDELVADQAAALAAASAEEAIALADYERALAAADFYCRATTLDPAVVEVAADLAPVFVERNRPQLEALIPPPGEEPSLAGLGTGDVQVTLRWWSTVDLDLSVVDPAGNRVSYASRSVASGGKLDRDANYPCDSAGAAPVENVFWPPAGAPPGPYRATVTYQTGCSTQGTQSYELTIRFEGAIVRQVRSTIEPGQEITVELVYEGT